MFVRIAALTIALASLAPAGARQSAAAPDTDDAQWEIFYRGTDGAVGAFRKPPGMANGILSAEIRVRQWNPEDKGSEGLFWIEQDCAGQTSRMLRGRIRDGKGDVQTRDEPEDWTAIRPDTPAAALSARLFPPTEG